MSSARWSVGHRISAGFALVLAVVAALVATIALRLWQNDRSSEAVQASISRSQRIDELERSVLLFALSTRDALLERNAERLAQFAASEARLTEAARTLQREEVDSAAAAQARAVSEMVFSYVSAGRRAVDEATRDTGELAVLRRQLMVNLLQMAGERDARAAATLGEMAANRQAARMTLAAGAVLTCVLLVLIALATVRSIRRPVRELLGVAAALRAGRWQPALALHRNDTAAPAARFELSQIAQAFGAAAAALEAREQRLMAHRDIAKAASSSLERSEVAARSLRVLVQHVGAEVGVIYCDEPVSRQLVPVATYSAGALLPAVSYGEGLVGQCARDRAPLVVREIPRDSPFVVRLGYDEAPPRMAAAVPILLHDDTVGVLLVASLREFDAGALEFLDSAAAQVAVGLANARAYHEVQELLATVRAQGERIQVQNEELQIQGEEIQAQNEKLQAWTEQVQVQNEELQAQSEELQAQGEEIQAQNDDLQRNAMQLQEQAAALRQADERKNEFLGVLAHELRNPITPIANCVELLKRKGAEPKTFEYAQQVLQRQVQHITRLINDLLDVTRISRGKVSLTSERLNVSELVQECVADQRTSLAERGIELVLELPEVPIHVEGDHTRLCQVFSNLLNNAVKFCRSGSHVEVRATLDAPAREVAVHIVDDGIGIDGDLIHRIFEPFIQGEDELARTRGGLGLGLALAKALVELHGGRIEARSKGRGQGARGRIRGHPAPGWVAGPRRQQDVGDSRANAPACRRFLARGGDRRQRGRSRFPLQTTADGELPGRCCVLRGKRTRSGAAAPGPRRPLRYRIARHERL